MKLRNIIIGFGTVKKNQSDKDLMNKVEFMGW